LIGRFKKALNADDADHTDFRGFLSVTTRVIRVIRVQKILIFLRCGHQWLEKGGNRGFEPGAARRELEQRGA